MQNFQPLVNAQVHVNRAVFESNMPFDIPGCNHEPRMDYVLEQVQEAIKELKKFQKSIEKTQFLCVEMDEGKPRCSVQCPFCKSV